MLASELGSIEVLRMDFRHVELKFSMAQCISRDKVRVSYFQRPGLRDGFRAWVKVGVLKIQHGAE